MAASTEPIIVGAPSELGLLWQEAVDRYTQIVENEYILATRQSATIGGILAEIGEMESTFGKQRHDGSKRAKFRSLVSESLAPIQALGEMAAHASKAAFPPSEVIFVAVRYLITAAKIVSGDYDKLTEFFQDVKSYLSGIQMWESQVPSAPQLKYAITTVFSSVLVLCGVYTRYINKKRVVKAFRALVSGEDAGLKDAHQHFRKAVQHGRDIVQNATLSSVEQTKANTQAIHTDIRKTLSFVEGSERSMSSVAHGTERINRYLDCHERDTTLRWLSGLNFRERQREIFSKHHVGTGRWLLDASVFRDWVYGTRTSTMWCPGDPGTGKTVMMSAAICYVEENTADLDRALAYVYCNYKETKTHLTTEIWSSVVRQFAEQCDPFPPEVQAFRDKFIEKGSRPTEDDLISLVILFTRLFRRAFVFIDALDECPEEVREGFVDSVAKVESSVRLFVTCRHSVELEGRLSNMTRVAILAHQDDIRAYIEHRLDTNARLRSFSAQDPGLRSLILEKLLGQANGMFLLVHLQMEQLCNKRRPLEARKALGTLAKSVHQFYDDSLQRIEELEEEDREFALRVLSYVFCARRPLSLKELLHALSVEREATDLLGVALYQKFLVFSVSSGLIRVDEESSCVRLAHLTLHEHLQRFPEKLLAGHEQDLATACLTYLSFEPFAQGPCVEACGMTERLSQYCFLEYACRHWPDHAAKYTDEETSRLILALLREKNKLAACAQILHLPRYRVGNWHDQFPRSFTCLHAAAYWGLDKVLDGLGNHELDFNSRDSSGATPLFLSARHGHVPMVKRLLETTAEVDIPNNRCETALMLAARNGHGEAVEALLARGANHAAEDIEGWTALHWAIMGGHNQVVKMLLGTAAHNQSDKTQQNKALCLAAEAGSHTTVQMLLDEGADVDYRDDQGSTPLHWAVPEGRIEACKVLLDHGADPSSRDGYGNTPMHWTVSHPALARLLSSHGADVSAKNDSGQSTLLWSALAGKLDSVESMIELGADIDAGNGYGFTALHAAALQGYEHMARMLLHRGADANKRDVDGWTALHAAALKGRNALVGLLLCHTRHGPDTAARLAEQLKDDDVRALMEEMADRKSVGSTVVRGLRAAINSNHDQRLLALLDKGANIDAEDELGGETALTYAAWFGREKTVRLLLAHGADVDLRERSGRTALHWAAYRGHAAVVADLVEIGGAGVDTRVFGWTAMLYAARTWQRQLVLYLVEHGADVGARDFHGRTALHWSCVHGDKVLAERLLRLGADVDARDRCGQTALHWAVARGESATARLLLRRNADAALPALDGSTALHLAAYTGRADAAAVLLQERERRSRRRNGGETAQAAETTPNADRLTALDMARLTGNVQVAQLLGHHGRGDDGLHGGPQPQAPPLPLSKDEEHDYSLASGPGRALFSHQARRWLRERREQQRLFP